MNNIMKKVLLGAVIVALLAMGAACGKKDNADTEPQKAQTSVQKDDAEKSDEAQEQAEAENAENKEENAPGEAPVIESAEQLEGMINEFNETEDPERKEELRKQLEAILSQAEAASEEK